MKAMALLEGSDLTNLILYFPIRVLCTDVDMRVTVIPPNKVTAGLHLPVKLTLVTQHRPQLPSRATVSRCCGKTTSNRQLHQSL